MMMWNWSPGWHWLWMAGVWIVGIAIIVWAVTVLFPAQHHRDAQQVLDERLARGEIDVDEYRQRRVELVTHAGPSDHTGT